MTGARPRGKRYSTTSNRSHADLATCYSVNGGFTQADNRNLLDQTYHSLSNTHHGSGYSGFSTGGITNGATYFPTQRPTTFEGNKNVLRPMTFSKEAKGLVDTASVKQAQHGVVVKETSRGVSNETSIPRAKATTSGYSNISLNRKEPTDKKSYLSKEFLQMSLNDRVMKNNDKVGKGPTGQSKEHKDCQESSTRRGVSSSRQTSTSTGGKEKDGRVATVTGRDRPEHSNNSRNTNSNRKEEGHTPTTKTTSSELNRQPRKRNEIYVPRGRATRTCLFEMVVETGREWPNDRDTVIVYEGDDTKKLGQQFAVKHGLSFNQGLALYYLIESAYYQPS
eukprot:Ihof_evm1s777 gene=Ihof_evmTU1s777